MLVILGKQFPPLCAGTGMKTWFICLMTASLIQLGWTNQKYMTVLLLLLLLSGMDQSEFASTPSYPACKFSVKGSRFFKKLNFW